MRFWLLIACLSVSIAACNAPPPAAAQLPAATSLPSSPLAAPVLEGCSVYPDDHIWNAPIDDLPVDPRSDAYIQTIGPNQTFHPDFGSGTWDGFPIGIPYNVVPGSQAKYPVEFYYPDESDPGPYPIPPNPLIEGDPQSGDRHIIILDRDNCILYELYDAWHEPDGWHAGSGAIFNPLDYSLRPAGWTSADAAGLPILPGLVRYDEVLAGEITHAIRFTAQETRSEYVWPARHHAATCQQSDPLDCPPMGQRFRLKASYDISTFSAEVQVILRAMKKYGIILADNGSDWYLSGVPDERWDNDTLVGELDDLPGWAFEAVDVSPLMQSADSGQVRGMRLVMPLIVQTFTPAP